MTKVKVFDFSTYEQGHYNVSTRSAINDQATYLVINTTSCVKDVLPLDGLWIKEGAKSSPGH